MGNMYPDSKSLRHSSRILGNWDYEIFALPAYLEIGQGHLLGLLFNVLNVTVGRATEAKTNHRTQLNTPKAP
jgi:hypothetical protein